MLTPPSTPELEQRLQEEADKRGMPTTEYALRLLAESLAQETGELDVLLDAGMGAFAHVPFSSEDRHHERRAEVEREERSFQQRFSQEKSGQRQRP